MRRFDRCEYCGGAVVGKKVTVDIRRKGELFVFENVPVGVCSGCGERYYTGPVLERLNEIAAHRDTVKSTIKVPYLDFAEVTD
jgi:YgiT-type zinc finger domain-containing protein